MDQKSTDILARKAFIYIFLLSLICSIPLNSELPHSYLQPCYHQHKSSEFISVYDLTSLPSHTNHCHFNHYRQIEICQSPVRDNSQDTSSITELKLQFFFIFSSDYLLLQSLLAHKDPQNQPDLASICLPMALINQSPSSCSLKAFFSCWSLGFTPM